MALKEKNIRLLAWTRNCEVRKKLLADKVIDATADTPEPLLNEADITVLCMPVARIPEFCVEYRNAFKPGSVVTDIASVKTDIMEKTEATFKDTAVSFVGGHPMAGTEKSGPDAAFSELYDNAVVFLTPGANTDKEVLDTVSALWKTVNAKPVVVDYAEHDKLVAFTSHISHMIALALTESVLDCSDKECYLRRLACCSAFRDGTRVASSSPTMWREIIERNTDNVVDALQMFKDELELLITTVKKGQYDDFEHMFTSAKLLRDDWMKERYPDMI